MKRLKSSRRQHRRVQKRIEAEKLRRRMLDQRIGELRSAVQAAHSSEEELQTALQQLTKQLAESAEYENVATTLQKVRDGAGGVVWLRVLWLRLEFGLNPLPAPPRGAS